MRTPTTAVAGRSPVTAQARPAPGPVSSRTRRGIPQWTCCACMSSGPSGGLPSSAREVRVGASQAKTFSGRPVQSGSSSCAILHGGPRLSPERVAEAAVSEHRQRDERSAAAKRHAVADAVRGAPAHVGVERDGGRRQRQHRVLGGAAAEQVGVQLRGLRAGGVEEQPRGVRHARLGQRVQVLQERRGAVGDQVEEGREALEVGAECVGVRWLAPAPLPGGVGVGGPRQAGRQHADEQLERGGVQLRARPGEGGHRVGVDAVVDRPGGDGVGAAAAAAHGEPGVCDQVQHVRCVLVWCGWPEWAYAGARRRAEHRKPVCFSGAGWGRTRLADLGSSTTGVQEARKCRVPKDCYVPRAACRRRPPVGIFHHLRS